MKSSGLFDNGQAKLAQLVSVTIGTQSESGTIDPASCRQCEAAVPKLSLGANLGLAAYKMAIGLLSGSVSLLADALQSLAAAMGSFAILISTEISSRPANDDHPYGYAKAEHIGAIFVYTIVTLFGVGIVAVSVAMIARGETAPPHLVALLGAAISLGTNWVLFNYFNCVGTRNRSPGIMANAFANRADAFSSLAAIGGIAAALIIHPIFDQLAALVVGVMIAWISIGELGRAAGALMDRAIDPDSASLVRRVALDHDDVLDVEYVRTRQTGGGYWLDLGVVVPATFHAGRAAGVAAELRRSLLDIGGYEHVEVYVTPPSRPSER